MPTKRKSTIQQETYTKIQPQQRSRSRNQPITQNNCQTDMHRILDPVEANEFRTKIEQLRQPKLSDLDRQLLHVTSFDQLVKKEQLDMKEEVNKKTIRQQQPIMQVEPEAKLSAKRLTRASAKEKSKQKKREVFEPGPEPHFRRSSTRIPIHNKKVDFQVTQMDEEPAFKTKNSSERFMNRQQTTKTEYQEEPTLKAKNSSERLMNRQLITKTEYQEQPALKAKNSSEHFVNKQLITRTEYQEEPTLKAKNSSERLMNRQQTTKTEYQETQKEPKIRRQPVFLKIEAKPNNEKDHEIKDYVDTKVTKYQAPPQISKNKNKIDEEQDLSTSISLPMKKSKFFKQYASVIEQLHENAIPPEIQCRDQEKLQIENFLKEGLNSGGQSQALYISGVPGIGKTASFLEVKSKLQKQNSKKFHFIHINGMNLNAPEGIYCQILFELTKIDKVSRTQACIILTELFTTGRLPIKYKQYESEVSRGNKILLLDECDFLVTPNQQLLYNLVDWPQQKHSKLTLVMIANTMDFPEKLKPKLQSRLGNHRLVYRPYQSQQIEQIIQQRIQSSQARTIFQSDALTFVSKKVVTISTDIRKTLNICRNSVELARDEFAHLKSQKLNKVTIEHVKAAYNKVYSEPYHFCLTHLHDNVKLLLITIALEAHHKGYNIAYMENVCARYNLLSSTYNGNSSLLNSTQLTQMLAPLQTLNVVETKEKIWLQNSKISEATKIKFEVDPLQRQQYYNVQDLQIQMTIGIDDLKNSLKDDKFFLKFSGLF